MQRRHDHLRLRADATAMKEKRNAKSYIKELIHTEECKNPFVILFPHFNPRSPSSLCKLKLPIETNYDFMHIPNNNLKWRTIEDPEEIEVLLILRNKQCLR